MAFEDRQQLDAFVAELHDVLRTVIFEHSDWLPDDLWTSYEVAFMALRGSVDETRATLLPERFTDPSAEYQQGLDIALERAGLTGTQLELKLSGWRRAIGFFRAGPTRSLLRRALRWANVLLGSLAGVVGAAEALKEFKETVETGVEEEEA
jgi:hypothetical protein